RIGQRTRRATLPTPGHGCHGKTAPAQVGHHLEVFLDELAAPSEQTYGAAAGPTRRRPADEPEARAVSRLELTGNSTARHRILSQRYKLHASASRSANHRQD